MTILERLARVVDPEAFDEFDGSHGHYLRQESALTKARAILSDPLFVEVREALCGSVAIIEDVLDEERIEHDECAAMDGFKLCGAAPCQSAGCVVGHLRRARTALAMIEEITGEDV